MKVLGRTPQQTATILLRRAKADEQMLTVLRATAVLEYRLFHQLPVSITPAERDVMADTVLEWMYTQMPAMFIDRVPFAVETLKELLGLVFNDGKQGGAA